MFVRTYEIYIQCTLFMNTYDLKNPAKSIKMMFWLYKYPGQTYCIYNLTLRFPCQVMKLPLYLRLMLTKGKLVSLSMSSLNGASKVACTST